MPQNLVIMKLFGQYSIANGSSAESGIINMQDYVRIESLWVRATEASGSPTGYTLQWVGGIQEDEFQPYADNANLITSETDEDWHILYPPDFKSPYVKFKITAASGGGAGTTVYDLFAYVREDFA